MPQRAGLCDNVRSVGCVITQQVNDKGRQTQKFHKYLLTFDNLIGSKSPLSDLTYTGKAISMTAPEQQNMWSRCISL